MRLEVRKSGGPTCPACESFQLIKVLRQPDTEPEMLMRDLHTLVSEPPWWHPFQRRWWRSMAAALDSLEGELLEGARFPIAPTEAELGEIEIDRS